MTQDPVFIGGLAHSGKTPLRLMLAAHPRLAMTRHTALWTRFYNGFGDLRNPDHFERCLAAMVSHKSVQPLQPDADAIRRQFWQGEPTYVRLFAIVHSQHAERMGKPRWGEQLGLIEQYADIIFAAFPHARLIHLIRDPRDRYQVSGKAARQRQGKAGWSTARWLFSARLAHRNQKRYPHHYKVVRYETLVCEPEAALRDICAFLEEPFVPEMLAMSGAPAAAEPSPPAAAVLRKPANGSLPPGDLAFIQAAARPDLLAFGYPLQPVPMSRRDRLLFYLINWPVNRAGMAAWHALRATTLSQYLEKET